jgi:erythromycin esterase
LADKCEATLKRLEEKRADTVGMQGADIEWAIQNARLVLQYVQMQAGTKSRDQSMAENVEWIAKQNPKAKIILWAHNAHVGFESPAMGTYLREAFRDKYINFGFAFDQGAFRASTGSHLEDFAVGPAPPLSLDGVLSSVGLPLFVLDLRHVSDRAAADWLDKPHAARSIGALYDSLKPNSAFTEVSPRRVFDIIVFVSKTTAARSLP